MSDYLQEIAYFLVLMAVVILGYYLYAHPQEFPILGESPKRGAVIIMRIAGFVLMVGAGMRALWSVIW